MSVISDYPILTDYIRDILRGVHLNEVRAIRSATTEDEAEHILTIYSYTVDGDNGYGNDQEGLACSLADSAGGCVRRGILRALRDNNEFVELINKRYGHYL